jgi:membrane-bound acyltransferase YfiQ involved in biofilm formation
MVNFCGVENDIGGDVKMQVKEIFFIRCISCLSVVMIHVLGITMHSTSSMLMMLLMFSTPAFIFISEFLLSYSYPNGTPKGFLLKRIQFIFLPFLFVAFVDAVMMSSLGDNATLLSFLQRISANIFLGNFIGYFILIIFQFYLLHIFFHQILQRISAKFVLSIAFLINGGYLTFVTFIDIPSFGPNPIFPISWIPFVGWVFYFCLAYYCGQNYKGFISLLDQYRYIVYGLVALSAFMILNNTYFGFFEVSSKRPDILLYTTSIIFLFFHLFSKVSKVPSIIMTISNYSFSIYLFHVYFLGIGLTILNSFTEVQSSLSLMIIYSFSIVGPMMLSWIFNHFKYGYMFVGKIYKPKQSQRRNTVSM